jgi:uncharacterized protein (TIGR00299 family) protein
MKIMIIDPIGGISGDMLLGSLVHMGCPADYLDDVFRQLPVGSFAMKTDKRFVNGIEALDLKFETEHSLEERTFTRIKHEILMHLPAGVQEISIKIFEVLAQAEAEVHGVNIEDIHFHEVGAIDSILDIVGIAAALKWFGIDAVYTRPLPLGTGMTRSMHGTIPVPAPATVKLLEGINVRFTQIEAELTTPTGAAVIRAVCEKGDPPSDIIVKGVGYGCGDRVISGWPNLCRVILGETPSDTLNEPCYMVEADVDDMSPEEWEAASERIFSAGALDVSITSRIMKKGRPGAGVKAICTSALLDNVLTALLTHTTSIGARYYPLSRRVLERREYTLKTRYGKVHVKEVVTPSGKRRAKPEYRDMDEISRKHNIPLVEVREELLRLIKKDPGQDRP